MYLSYRDDEVYKKLEKLVSAAGVHIVYGKVHNDHIDGEIWARSDPGSMSIFMPEKDTYLDDDTVKACQVLGHEFSHILTGLDSPDFPGVREMNEAMCDFGGGLLYRLAEMILMEEAEQAARKMFAPEEGNT